jgi:hypothetical protein
MVKFLPKFILYFILFSLVCMIFHIFPLLNYLNEKSNSFLIENHINKNNKEKAFNKSFHRLDINPIKSKRTGRLSSYLKI